MPLKDDLGILAPKPTPTPDNFYQQAFGMDAASVASTPTATPTAKPTPAPTPQAQAKPKLMDDLGVLKNVPKMEPPPARPNGPLFNEEGPQFYQRAFEHNKEFAQPGPYTTKLSPDEEKQFRSWVKSNKVEFDPSEQVSDYDMRGYWKDIASKGKSETAINSADHQIHFPDTYKTPYDTTFSGESKYAKPGTPFKWEGNDLIDSRTGRKIFSPKQQGPTKPADVSDTEWARRQAKATKDLYAHNPALGEQIAHETADQAGDTGTNTDPTYVIGDMAAALLAPETGGLSLAAIPGVAAAGLKSIGAQEGAALAMDAFGRKLPNHPYLQAGVGLLAPLLFDAGLRRVRLSGKPSEAAALEPKPAEAPTEPASVPAETKPEAPQTKATNPNFSVSETGDLTNHSGNVFRIPRNRVELKPEVYQHKIGADPETGGGIALTDVKKFDVGKSGVLTVHHTGEYGTPSSKYYIVNGHQRLNAADRLNVQEPLRYQVLDEGNTHPGAISHNVTAEQARAYGATINLAEGRGTALDAAKYFRDSGIQNPAEALEREGVSLTERKAQDAVALSQLSDNFFRDTVNGKLPENRAAVIGRELGGNLPGQEKLYADLKRYEAEGKDFPEKKLEELIKLEKGAGYYEQTQTDLFGSRVQEKSYSPQMADILSHAREQLGSEKRIFGSAEKNAARLERGGSSIDTERASAIQQGAATRSDLLDRFAYKSGTQANATLRKYAEIVANSPASARKGILKDAYKDLYDSLEKDYQASFGADKNLAGVAPEAGPQQGNLLAGNKPPATESAPPQEPAPASTQELEAAGQGSMFGGASKPPEAGAVNPVRDAETTPAPTTTERFHGSQTPLNKLSSLDESPESRANWYGPGFYTTEVPELAQAAARGWTDADTVPDNGFMYRVHETKPNSRFFNLREPAPDWIKDTFRAEAPALYENVAKVAEGKFGKDFSTQNLIETLNDTLRDEPALRHEFDPTLHHRAANEILLPLRQAAEKQGYSGFDYFDPSKTGIPAKSRIYFHPESDIRLEEEKPETTASKRTTASETKPELSGTTLHGGVPLAAPAARMAGNWISSTVERIGNAPSTIKETATDISNRVRTTFAPETLGPHAKRMAGIIRAAAAKSAASDYRATALLTKTRNELEKIPDTLERFRQFYSPIQRGKIDELPENLRGAARVVRDLEDRSFDEIRDLTDKGVSYRENYLPNLYKNPAEQVRAVFSRLANVGGKTLQTGKGFLKHKTYQDILDAIDPEKAQEGALTPRYDNPVDMVLADLRLKNRYVMGQTIFQAGKDAGIIKFFKTGEHPDGWSRIDDSIATVKHLEKDGHLGEVGHYMAPDDAALVLNRFLGKRLTHDPGVAGGLAKFNRIYVGAGNAFRVGLSAFHFMFESAAQSAQAMGEGIFRTLGGALRGDVSEIKSGAKTMGRALTPLEAWRTAKMGSKIQRAMLEPGTQGEAFDRAVQYVLKGGGRFGRETVALSDSLDAAMKDIEKSTGPVSAMGKTIHAISKPLMDHFVPKMKLGAFFKIAERQVGLAMERNGGELTEVQLRHVLQDSWDHVDSVFGQMVRDNQFMSNSMKDAMHIAMAFPGWNLGTARVASNAIKGAVKGIAGIPMSGKQRAALEFGVGLLAFHMIQNSMLNYLFTGELPRGRDYFQARDGGHDKYGNPTRVNVPDYFRTIYSAGTHPVRWAENIANIPFQWAKEFINNEDYFGNQIRNPSDSALTQAGQVAKHFGADILPFSIQNATQTSQEQGVGWLRKALSYAGVTPAAREFRQTKAQNMIDDVMSTREHKSSTPEEAQHIKDSGKLHAALRAHKDDEARAILRTGHFSPWERDEAIKNAALPPFQGSVSRLIPLYGNSAQVVQGFKDAFNVYNASSDAEKQQAASVILYKWTRALNGQRIAQADLPELLSRVKQIAAEQRQAAAQKRAAAMGG